MILLEPANTITHCYGEIKRRTISLTGIERRAVRSGLHPPPQSLYPLESAIYQLSIAAFARKTTILRQSENHLPATVPAFVSQFSERNSGSSFFEWKWTAGSMSHLDGEAELQTRSLASVRSKPTHTVNQDGTVDYKAVSETIGDIDTATVTDENETVKSSLTVAADIAIDEEQEGVTYVQAQTT
jgi:hypothetical protein